MKRTIGGPRALSALTLLALGLASGVAAAQGAPPPDGAPGAAPPPMQAGGLAPPASPPMQAGGLAPPPPMSTPPGQAASPTEQQLDKAKEEDSGRGLTWVWIDAQGGYEHVGLQTFNVDTKNFTAGFVPTTANGGVVAPGLGLKLLFLTIGARARIGFFDSWQLFSVGPELGLHFPLGNFEPHLDFAGGYTALGSFQGAIQGANDAIHIRGFFARIGAGLDYYVTPAVSLGAAVSWELLGLTRPGVDPSTVSSIQASSASDAQKAEADALKLQGTSYGSALAITAGVGLHF